jgi:hypothetical protein
MGPDDFQRVEDIRDESDSGSDGIGRYDKKEVSPTPIPKKRQNDAQETSEKINNSRPRQKKPWIFLCRRNEGHRPGRIHAHAARKIIDHDPGYAEDKDRRHLKKTSFHDRRSPEGLILIRTMIQGTTIRLIIGKNQKKAKCFLRGKKIGGKLGRETGSATGIRIPV